LGLGFWLGLDLMSGWSVVAADVKMQRFELLKTDAKAAD